MSKKPQTTTEKSETELEQEVQLTTSTSSDSENLSQNDTVENELDLSSDDWSFLKDDNEEVVAEEKKEVAPKTDEAALQEEKTETEEEAEPPVDENVETAEQEETEEEVETPDYEAIRQLLGEGAAQALQTQNQQQEQTSQQAVIPPQQEQQPSVDQQEQVRALRQKAEEEFASQFQLTEDEVEDFRENPNAVLPKLLARAALSTFDSLIQGVNRQLPLAVAQVVDLRQRTAEGEQAFYTVWPQLKDTKYKDTINRVADAYAAANPNAPFEQKVREIGAQAWIALKLPLDKLMTHVQQFSAPTQTPSKTTKPVSKTFRKPANAGHVPAGRAVSNQPKSEFDSYIDELIEDGDL